jgi:carbon storage regulator
MLVLSRSSGQEIVIGKGITVRILDVKKNRVRIGVVAPADAPIRRESICSAIAGIVKHREDLEGNDFLNCPVIAGKTDSPARKRVGV